MEHSTAAQGRGPGRRGPAGGWCRTLPSLAGCAPRLLPPTAAHSCTTLCAALSRPARQVRDLLRNPAHNSVMLAYGITAAGKTYTIEGSGVAPGVMPRALGALFEGLAAHVEPVAVRVAYYEVRRR